MAVYSTLFGPVEVPDASRLRSDPRSSGSPGVRTTRPLAPRPDRRDRAAWSRP
jgi:hypothetical protein